MLTDVVFFLTHWHLSLSDSCRKTTEVTTLDPVLGNLTVIPPEMKRHHAREGQRAGITVVFPLGPVK